jgi:hypothetical protein
LKFFLKEQAQIYSLLDNLALINVGLVDKARALPLRERAMAANPIEKDVKAGSASIET